MRWSLVVCVLSVVCGVASCVQSGTAASTGTTSGAADAATPCDVTALGCSNCEACANQGSCANEAQACQVDPDCTSIDQCIYLCAATDASCKSQCESNNPNGIGDYQTWAKCLGCQACPTTCPNLTTCP